MIWHVLEAFAATAAVFGLGWAACHHWEQAGRDLDALIEEETAELRAIPRVAPHEPVPIPIRIAVVPGPRPVIPAMWVYDAKAKTPIFDGLAAEFERRVHPPDEALAAALAAGAEFVAGLDSWADGARALVRGSG